MSTTGFEIAIIGMSGRFPGANDIDEFWENLKKGVEAISFFSEEDEMRHTNPDMTKAANYIAAKGILDNIEYFDADFFEFTPREAEVMDPQLKALFECVWDAMENAGYNPCEHKGMIGSYIGASLNLGWLTRVITAKGTLSMNDMMLSGSDFFSTRLSYKFNLRGPSLTVQTACSTSLVAVHLACQALISGECDMAIAGGVKISIPQKAGYLYQEGSIMSKDGHCRAFDANASGTVGGDGAGIVLLKRLEDAVNDGDHIYAVIKGSAINNDGTRKVGYTAPSPEGQAEAIKAALYMSEVEPESISYIEAHGTGTVMGDPIELEGLKMALGKGHKGNCRLGAVKSSIGHLDNAAGVAGLIKTALSLKNRQIPPSLNYEKPNPNINFESSPFLVNTELIPWENKKYPLRAGVSSFGIGGTNAHVILEEAPTDEETADGKEWKIISLSARTSSALQKMSENLAEYLNKNAEINLWDAAYTLHIGRKEFKHRKAFVCSGIDEAVRELSSDESSKAKSAVIEGSKKDVVFMFPGQGAQYVNMGKELYQKAPVFRKELDKCFEILHKIDGFDVKNVLYPTEIAEGDGRINQTGYTQPIIFAFEYALAKLLISWGIRPSAMIGHSIGEYAAACLAEVFTLEDAMKLVYTRGRLMQSLPKGSMLSVQESEEKLAKLINDRLSIAAVNGEKSCVISGPDEDIEELEKYLAGLGCNAVRLHTSHAFHSPMVEPILNEFRNALSKVNFGNIKIPYISNVTGKWITNEEASNPDYWTAHLRDTVRFYSGIEQLTQKEENVYLEIGPGKTLNSFVKQYLKDGLKKNVLNTVRHPKEDTPDIYHLLSCLSHMWLLGVDINWKAFYSDEKRKRVPLPTYPYEKKRFFMDNTVQGGFNIGKVNSGEADNNTYKVYDRIEEVKYIPPANEKEQKIVEVFRQVLGINRIGADEDFFELGGDSLRAMEVAAKLRKDFIVNINDIFKYPSAEKLARNITMDIGSLEKLVDRLKNADNESRSDSSFEVRLNIHEKVRKYRKTIKKYKKMSLEGVRSYRDILLTGSTGYLGVFLLRDLLETTGSKLHLVIRGESADAAKERLCSKLDYYFGNGLYEKYKDRIIIYAGDLSEKNLGVDSETYEALCRDIDCIIHSAAKVSHFGNYEDSYRANVEATKLMIELAKAGRKKDFNYISTLGVVEGDIDGIDFVPFTEYDCDLGQKPTAIYAKSKLEAEKLLIKEREEGLNVNIFRLGNVLFDSSTGKFQDNKEQNAVYSVIKSYIKLGLIPKALSNISITCVDYASKAIALLFNREELMNETYHLESQSRVDMAGYLSSDNIGLGVRAVTNEEFLDYLRGNYDNKELLQYIGILFTHLIRENASDENLSRTRVHIYMEKTSLLLGKLEFQWNEIGESDIKKMIEHCKKVNFI